MLDIMEPVQAWLSLEGTLMEHSRHMMERHGCENLDLQNHPESIQVIDTFQRVAHRKWFSVWTRTFLTVLSYVVGTAKVLGTIEVSLESAL